jgi:hypothetical protein
MSTNALELLERPMEVSCLERELNLWQRGARRPLWHRLDNDVLTREVLRIGLPPQANELVLERAEPLREIVELCLE